MKQIESLLLEYRVVYLKDDKLMMTFLFLDWVVLVTLCSMWDLSSLPKTELMSLTLGAWSLNHWTTRELSWFLFLNLKVQSLKNTVRREMPDV